MYHRVAIKVKNMKKIESLKGFHADKKSQVYWLKRWQYEIDFWLKKRNELPAPRFSDFCLTKCDELCVKILRNYPSQNVF